MQKVVVKSTAKSTFLLQKVTIYIDNTFIKCYF